MANRQRLPLPTPEGNSARAQRNLLDAAKIEAWLLSYISEMLGVRPESIDVRLPFTYFGLSSAEGVILAGDLEKWLGGRRLSATLAWDFPTIDAVANHLATGGNAGDSTSRSIVFENAEFEELLSEIEKLPEEQSPE